MSLFVVSALLRASLGTCFSLCRIASHWEADCLACHIDHVCSLHVLVRAALSKSMFLTGFVDQSCLGRILSGPSWVSFGGGFALEAVSRLFWVFFGADLVSEAVSGLF